MVGRFCQRVSVVALLCCVARPPMVSAQRVAVEPPPKAAVVSLDVVDQPVFAVLRTIARQAGLQASWGDQVLRLTSRITLRARDLPVVTAFATVLSGTGMRAKITGSFVSVVPDASAAPMAQGDITGTVIDAKTKRGVRGATVTLSGAPKSVTTRDDGGFHMSGIAAGTYTVSVRMLGYVKATKSIAVVEGQAVSVEITMEPSVNALDQVIVTGTVVATARKEVPNAMTVITAKDIEARGITRLDQFFRGDVPGLFAQNQGSYTALDEVAMFSRGATGLGTGMSEITNPIKTYVDGVEMSDAKYLSQIDPRSIERVEILTGPQASTIYGSNAINGVMQIFTKRGSSAGRRPEVTANLVSGWLQNDYSSALTPVHTADGRVAGQEGRIAYTVGGSVDYTGAWTPARLSYRTGLFGSARSTMRWAVADLSVRTSFMNNVRRGTEASYMEDLVRRGFYNPGSTGLGSTTGRWLSQLRTRTVGATISATPLSWWSHELVLGADLSSVRLRQHERGWSSPSDSLFYLSENTSERMSQRYATTANIPVTSLIHWRTTLGADHWRTQSMSVSTRSVNLTGTLATPTITRTHPGKNAGGFVQSQLGFGEAMFLTYGLRAEWNPNYGAEAQPNLAPRYGIAFTRELGVVTMKLRGSFGRSTRPPTEGMKEAVKGTSATRQALYGSDYETRAANPALGPEFQQGGEGGVDLYFGNYGSLIVTKYNQTVDALIANVSRADSTRSLRPVTGSDFKVSVDDEGYGYIDKSMYLNVGSIRNQGWELQGSLNTGPLTTRGTYSWTKSRVLGVDARYRSLLTGKQYQVGAPFAYLPEHTWALTTTYARAGSAVSLSLNGVGLLSRGFDELGYATGCNGLSYIRLTTQMIRYCGVGNYTWYGRGYTMADFNASHRLTSNVETTVQVLNLTDFYQNDVNAGYATLGRQTRLGARIRW